MWAGHTLIPGVRLPFLLKVVWGEELTGTLMNWSDKWVHLLPSLWQYIFMTNQMWLLGNIPFFCLCIWYWKCWGWTTLDVSEGSFDFSVMFTNQLPRNIWYRKGRWDYFRLFTGSGDRWAYTRSAVELRQFWQSWWMWFTVSIPHAFDNTMPFFFSPYLLWPPLLTIWPKTASGVVISEPSGL